MGKTDKKAGKKPGKDSDDKPTDNSGGGSMDNGAILRRSLGLTATVAPETQTIHLPDPYSETCLEEGNDADSLIQLAKDTFRKLSSQNSKWSPTAIQLQSWPILKSKSSKEKKKEILNLMAIATTGSGKTLGYTIPMIDSCALVKGKESRRYVHGLVLVPTRELALQVSKTLEIVTKRANKLSGSDKIVSLAIYGGVSREDQMDSLRKNSQLIVAATPLRLIDLLGIGTKETTGTESTPNESIQKLFESTRYLVIDEADQMATKSDMSQQVDLIINFLREKSTKLKKQCLFSATLPRRAIAKCNDWIPLPRAMVKVDTVTVGGKSSTKDSTSATTGGESSNDKVDKRAERRGPLDLSTIPAHITQTLHVCSNHKKPKKLMTTIEKIRKSEKEGGKRRSRGLTIIFFGRIKTLQYVHGLLQKEQIQGVALHSQMNQQKRESQLNLFRSGKCPILLATDVAARGIHIKNVEYIVNYDFPGSLEQYVHRCGRAGRSKVSGGRSGEEPAEKTSNATVYSFFHRELAPMAKDMVELLSSCKAWVDPNLVALVPGGMDGEGESKRKGRKRNREKSSGTETTDNGAVNAKKKNVDVKKKKKAVKLQQAENMDDNDDIEDEFPHLAPNRIVLKRASHVPDSDSDDDISS